MAYGTGPHNGINAHNGIILCNLHLQVYLIMLPYMPTLPQVQESPIIFTEEQPPTCNHQIREKLMHFNLFVTERQKIIDIV